MKTIIFILVILTTSTSFSAENKRSKSINFEDELVEGINRKPLDSVNQISEFEANQKKHLYRKRSGFVDRNKVVFDDLKLKN